MSFDMKARIFPDGRVNWLSMNSGATEVVARNDKEGVIAFLIRGQTFRDSVNSHAYAPAHFSVCKFRSLRKDKDSEMIEVVFFGNLLEWNSRKPWRNN